MDSSDRGVTEHAINNLVGERLKILREKQGMSQRELARRAGVTNGTLSNIELGRVSPSVASLEKILNTIPISMQEFFSEDLEVSPAVFRAEQFVRIRKNDTDYQILPLSDGGSYLARQSYAPGAKVTSEWMVRDGFVAGIVIEGVLELVLDGVEFTLSAGEGFNFAIHRSHAFKNEGDSDCVVVCVSLSN